MLFNVRMGNNLGKVLKQFANRMFADANKFHELPNRLLLHMNLDKAFAAK